MHKKIRTMLGRAGPSWGQAGAKLGQAGPSWAELGQAGTSRDKKDKKEKRMKRIKREKQVVKVRIRSDSTDLGDLKIFLLSLVIPHLLIKGIPKPIFDIPLVSTLWLRFGFCVRLTLQSFLLKIL